MLWIYNTIKICVSTTTVRTLKSSVIPLTLSCAVPLWSHTGSVLSSLEQLLSSSFQFCLLENRTFIYITFWNWVILCNIIVLRFIKVVVCFNNLFLLMNSFLVYECSSIPSYGFTTVSLSIHSFIQKHAVCLVWDD